MDKYTKVLVILTIVTSVMMVLGDLAYAKYRMSGARLRSSLQAAS